MLETLAPRGHPGSRVLNRWTRGRWPLQGGNVLREVRVTNKTRRGTGKETDAVCIMNGRRDSLKSTHT